MVASLAHFAAPFLPDKEKHQEISQELLENKGFEHSQIRTNFNNDSFYN
ncbi:MAG: hypothetical protein MK033_07465 [Candidatus Caenarcaniphilales bacterium]|nr:hypothetical protein [Candidatus Caenarcaniphilales bacterium]